MQFGNASWGFRETPLEEQLKITNEMGLSLLELGIANAPNDLKLTISDGEIENVKQLFKKYNISLLCAATGDDLTNGNNKDVAKIKKVIDICKKLGVKYLRIFAGFSSDEQVNKNRFDIMCECIKEIYNYAGNDVIPVIETHGGVKCYEDGVVHFMSVTTNIDRLLKIPNIKICYDPSNLYAIGLNPSDFYKKIKDKVCYVHLKDFVKLESGHLKPASCGESNMDWKNILCDLKGTDYPMLFEYENVEDVKEGLIRCNEYIKSVLIKI